MFSGHRRWFDKDDEWRSHGDLFNNIDETRVIQVKPRKKRKSVKEKMLLKVWKRKYVFLELDYWELLSTPHCLHVMHMTKNVCVIFLGTLFDMQEKSKLGRGRDKT